MSQPASWHKSWLKLRVAGCGLRIFFRPANFGNFKHRWAEIKAGDGRAAPCESKGDVAGAAAQVERAVVRLNGGESGDAAFPAPVQAEALQVVEQIVASGDGGEKVVDLRGALFARGAENVAHAASLSQGRAKWSKMHYIALRQRRGLVIWHKIRCQNNTIFEQP